VRGGGVQSGEVVDDLVGGSGPVGGDEDVTAPRRGDLGDRGGQDQQMIGAGERARVAGPQHDRQAIADVRAPRAEGMETVAALIL
jgi:hypothetical protein